MTNTYWHLCPEERGAIMAMKLQGSSARSIGHALGRAASTITRELRKELDAMDMALLTGQRPADVLRLKHPLFVVAQPL